MLARVRVRQSFHNPGQHWAEGIYVFPLPEQAAVDHLRLMAARVPVQSLIDAPDTAPELREKLETVLRARRFATEKLKLS